MKKENDDMLAFEKFTTKGGAKTKKQKEQHYKMRKMRKNKHKMWE